MNPPTDYLGREIKAGDTLVYPVRRGSSMWLNRILVTQALPAAVTGNKPDGRRTIIKNLGNTVVVSASDTSTV